MADELSLRPRRELRAEEKAARRATHGAWKDMRLDDFAYAFAAEGNLEKACAAVGMTDDDPKRLMARAKRLRNHPRVLETLRKIYANRRVRHELTAEAMIAEGARVAAVHIGQLVSWDEDGVTKFKRSSELTQEQFMAIKSMKPVVNRVTGETTTSIEMYDRLDYARYLAEMQGFIKNGRSIAIQNNRIEMSAERADEVLKLAFGSGGMGALEETPIIDVEARK